MYVQFGFSCAVSITIRFLYYAVLQNSFLVWLNATITKKKHTEPIHICSSCIPWWMESYQRYLGKMYREYESKKTSLNFVQCMLVCVCVCERVCERKRHIHRSRVFGSNLSKSSRCTKALDDMSFQTGFCNSICVHVCRMRTHSLISLLGFCCCCVVIVAV